MVAAPVILMLTWKGGWKAPCRVLSHKAQATADLVQPPERQQGWIFRFINVADVLLGKAAAPLSLKRSSGGPISAHLPLTSCYVWYPREHFLLFLRHPLPPLSLGSVWLGESPDFKGYSEAQVRVSAECWPSCAHDEAPCRPKGRGGPEIRHFTASPGQLSLSTGPPGGGPFGGLRALGRP